MNSVSPHHPMSSLGYPVTNSGHKVSSLITKLDNYVLDLDCVTLKAAITTAADGSFEYCFSEKIRLDYSCESFA